MSGWVSAFGQSEMLSFVTQITTVFDVLILQERVEYYLWDSTGFPNVVTDVIGGDKEVEQVVYIKALGKPLMFSASLFKHVSRCS